MKRRLRNFIAVTLSMLLIFSCFSIATSAAALKKLDLVFVIDTTGSMEDDIDEVKSNLKGYLDDLDETGMDYKIAVVDYRDFASRTDYSGDYPYSVKLDFSDDYDVITEAINSLSLGNGGDWEETIYSALIDGLDELTWRTDAGKAAILMGDAPALDPEPFTGYTSEMAINKLKNNDTGYEEHIKPAVMRTASLGGTVGSAERSGVTLFTIATSDDEAVVSGLGELAEGTGGKSYIADQSEDISEIVTEIIEVIPDTVEAPPQTDFFSKLLSILLKIWYFITFRWSKI